MSKELEIGKRYNLCNIIYAVVEDTTGYRRCDDCGFFIKEEGYCVDATPDKMGPCIGSRRSDKKDVIFVQVGEGNDPYPDGEVHEVR